FFQADDGIRGGHVTGVQTCALPIWFVQSSGPIPLVRVGRQPYGVLPVVASGRYRGDAIAGALASHLADLRGFWLEGSARVPQMKIGRASCRERGELWGGVGEWRCKW